jgi:hypothetical protein
MVFRRHELLQEFISMIFIEGRKDEIIKICDYYNHGISSIDDGIEWGMNFGEFIGRFYFGEEIWEFKFPEERGAVYFIGSLSDVRSRINDII